MPKVVEITLPPGQTEKLLSEIRALQGLIGLRLIRAASLAPPGDLITVEITNGSHPLLLRILDRHDIGLTSGSSVTTSMPLSIVATDWKEKIVKDSSDSSWEEMELMIARESNMTVNGLVLMAVSGFIAVCGVATGSLHVVIGAMLIAPGFEPLVRIPLGIASRGRSGLLRGAIDSAKAYSMVFMAAALAAIILELLGKQLLTGESAYLPKEILITYWTTLTSTSILASAAAAVAGAVLIATNRSVLTTGVMIALALIPSISVAAMAVVAGEYGLAARGLLRWIVEVMLVIVVSLLVFYWKQRHLHRRQMVL